MMEVTVLNMQGKKIDTADLSVGIFQASINVDLMHQAYVRQMANARLGTHNTKSRGDVSGGGRKPWRQKGTGRARHGSIRSPIWVGGGKAHTPKPRKYTKKMPRKMRRAALCSALSVKAADNEIIVLDELVLPEIKTRLMAQVLEKLVGDDSALILIPEKSEDFRAIELSTRNLPNAKTLLVQYLNIRDLLSYDKLILPLQALDIILDYLG
ncbi:MAG: 50S ribosomal protein L4 [Chloroflexota bacterium]|nr:50S ribosomal protein L4 [Chloroflexota bacterium]